VNLPADIIQLFGTSSVPVIVAGSVYGIFKFGDGLASQRAKDALSRWLVSFDVQKAKALPDGAQEVFEKIFGERHFTLKCFVRSAVFSLAAIAFITIVCLLIDLDPSEIFPESRSWYPWIVLALIVTWNIVFDYIGLFKTRLILRLLLRLRRRTTLAAIPVLAMDYIAYTILFTAGITVAMTLPFAFIIGESITWVWEIATSTLYAISNLRLLPPANLGWAFVLFWAGFAPSMWMWLYVAALFVTRALLRSEKLVSWLRWSLDIEKNPFRSIGAVAAALAFVASVAIILVSAEVSRISGAA
jgi:hypothetical protein